MYIVLCSYLYVLYNIVYCTFLMFLCITQSLYIIHFSDLYALFNTCIFYIVHICMCFLIVHICLYYSLFIVGCIIQCCMLYILQICMYYSIFVHVYCTLFRFVCNIQHLCIVHFSYLYILCISGILYIAHTCMYS